MYQYIYDFMDSESDELMVVRGEMGAPDDAAVQELQEFGLREYDKNRRLVILTGDGAMQLLQAYNKMKRHARALEEEQKSRIPMSVLARLAEKNLHRNPVGGREEFARTEDLLTTWSAANGGVGQDVLAKMGEAYEAIMSKERERAEHDWLMEHGGQRVSIEKGDYHDRSCTTEHHYK